MEQAGPARLTLVGTPIGNLEDISRRAVRVLGEAGVIFCEDTRRTRKLLSALGIPAPRLVRLDRHNEEAMADRVIAALEAGTPAVLVSDAGMPTISDPGAVLVKKVAGAGYPPDVVPGPCAVSTALALSGLPASQYRFAGFLPRKGRDRDRELAGIAAGADTVVIYEAANRVARTVADLAAACGPDRPLAAARELTKLHEEVWRGPLGEAEAALTAAGDPRGEFVLVIGPPGDDAPPPDPADRARLVDDALRARLDAGVDRRQAVAEVAAELGVQKRLVYDAALALKES